MTEQPRVAVFKVTLSGRPLHAHLVRVAEKAFDSDDEESRAHLEGLGKPVQLGAEELNRFFIILDERRRSLAASVDGPRT